MPKLIKHTYGYITGLLRTLENLAVSYKAAEYIIEIKKYWEVKRKTGKGKKPVPLYSEKFMRDLLFEKEHLDLAKVNNEAAQKIYSLMDIFFDGWKLYKQSTP